MRWIAPAAADIVRVEQEAAAFRRGSAQPIHGMAIIGEDVPPPDDATRKAMGDSMRKLLEHLESMHVIVDGKGFKNTILRSVMTGIILLGGRRGKVHVHANVSEAIYSISEITGQSVESITRQLNAADLLHN